MNHSAPWRCAAGAVALAALIAGPVHAAGSGQAPQPSGKMTVEGAKDAPSDTSSAQPQHPSSSAKVEGEEHEDTAVTGVKPGPGSSSTASGSDAPGAASRNAKGSASGTASHGGARSAKGTSAKKHPARPAQDAPR